MGAVAVYQYVFVLTWGVGKILCNETVLRNVNDCLALEWVSAEGETLHPLRSSYAEELEDFLSLALMFVLKIQKLRQLICCAFADHTKYAVKTPTNTITFY